MSVEKSRRNKEPSSATEWLPLVLIVLGLSLTSLWALHRFWYRRAIAVPPGLAQAYAQKHTKPNATTLTLPGRLSIKLEEAILMGNQWTVASDKGSHLAQSANPGEQGNIIVYGHNTNEILGPLRWTHVEEKIEVTTLDGLVHRYAITSIHEVDPSDIRFLQPTLTETLTIYTCAGFLDKNRFIVRAKPTP